MPDYEQMAAGVVKAAEGFITRALAGITQRIESLESHPPPKDGKDADPEIIAAMVAKAVADLPRPKDGKDADPEAIAMMVAKAVAALPPPKEPVHPDSVRLMVIDETAKTIATLPKPRDGVDGLGFDDLAVDYDGEREFAVKFQRGTEIKAFAFTLPIVLDRGVWREGQYQKGDGVTWAGSFWIAQRDTEAKPDAGNGDFRLAVKRGRDAK